MKFVFPNRPSHLFLRYTFINVGNLFYTYIVAPFARKASLIIRLKNYFTDGSKHYNAVQAPVVDNPCGEGNHSVNHALSAIIMAISNSALPVTLDDYVDGDIGWEMYILLNNTLYGHSNDNYKLVDIKEDLNLCPCRGPYLENILWTPDYTYTTNGYWTKIWPDGLPQRWNKGNRFRTTACEPVTNYYEVVVEGEVKTSWHSQQYNGLDYMLLYNLYRINYNASDNFPYADMRNNTIVSGTLPDGSEGTVSNFRTYNSFGSLSADIKLNAPVDNLPAGALMYGKSIKFKPGFQVKAGAQLVAQIHTDDIYDCWSGTFRVVPVPSHITKNPGIKQDYENYESNESEPLMNAGNTVTVFPNPATNRVQINGLDCMESVTVITSMGVNVRQVKGTNNEIDLSGMSSGSYFLKIKDCESKEHFIKLLITN